MNLLKYPKAQIENLVLEGLLNIDAVRHWEICKALADGKRIEQVAEDFKMHRRSIDWIKANKCRACTQ